MARQEVDREDILRDATALVLRAQMKVPEYDEPVVIGFRKDGSGSIYIGADPVYQFNSDLQLRRGFLGGELIKAEKGCLVALTRQRTGDCVLLVPHRFDETQTNNYLNTLSQHVGRLRAALQVGSAVVVGQVPESADVAEAVRSWLASLPADIEVARAPNAR